MQPYTQQVGGLISISGVDRIVASHLAAELGWIWESFPIRRGIPMRGGLALVIAYRILKTGNPFQKFGWGLP